jgi:hypothetical protein
MVKMETRIVRTAEEKEQVLVKYERDAGARPWPVGKGDGVIREMWVSTKKLRGRAGKRFVRITIGHGNTMDLPVE